MEDVDDPFDDSPATGQLDEHALLIRATYVEERSVLESRRLGGAFAYHVPARYDGLPESADADGRRRKPVAPVWPRLAARFAELRLPPALYMRTVFAQVPLGGHAPEPPQLLSQGYLAAWSKARQALEPGVRRALVSEIDLARVQIAAIAGGGVKTEREAAACVLLNEHLALSPLFRYCLALRIGGPWFRRLARRLEPAACTQYEYLRDFYRRHWKEWLPASFDQSSSLVYHRTHGRPADGRSSAP